MPAVGAAAGSLHHSGSLDVVLPSGKHKQVPWLVDAPANRSGGSTLAVCLLHGASGTADSVHLSALAAAVVSAGWPCLRLTCRGGNVAHRAEVCKAVLAQAPGLPGLPSVRNWVLAGHSMGARVACTLAGQQQAEHPPQGEQQQGAGLPPIAAVLLFSYPLHPPGRPAELRDELLAQLQLPALLVRGTRDPFSQLALWDAALARLGSLRWEQHSVQGGDHGLRCGAADGGSDAAMQGVAAAVRRFLLEVAVAPVEQQEARDQRARHRQRLPPPQPAETAGGPPASRGKRRRSQQDQQAEQASSAAAQEHERKPARSTADKREKLLAGGGESDRQTATGSNAAAGSRRRRG